MTNLPVTLPKFMVKHTKIIRVLIAIGLVLRALL